MKALPVLAPPQHSAHASIVDETELQFIQRFKRELPHLPICIQVNVPFGLGRQLDDLAMQTHGDDLISIWQSLPKVK